MRNKGKFPAIVEYIKGKGKYIKAAEKLLEINGLMKDGGKITKLLAGVIAVGELVNIFYPPDTPWDYFSNRGYDTIDTSIDGFLCELLMSSKLERKLVAQTMSDQAYMFSYGNITVGAIYSGIKYAAGPFLINRSQSDMDKVFAEIVWGVGSDIMLSARDNDDSWQASNKYKINTIPEPGPYLGLRNDPKEFSDRLARYGKSPRCIVLRGPTGVGKSVFARYVARHSTNDGIKTLKISSSALSGCRFEELITMIQVLKPTVLLLDDLSLSDPENTEQFLAMLEVLRDPDCIVIATVMTECADNPNKEPDVGDWYFPGMRPGRVDEFLTFYLPNEEERNLILRHYLNYSLEQKIPHWNKILKLTDGLSGAYLSEVARRLTVHGFDNWEKEIKNVRYASPKPRD